MSSRSPRTIAAALLAVGLLASAAYAVESNTAAPSALVNTIVRIEEGQDIDTVAYKVTVAMWKLAKQRPQATSMCLDVIALKPQAVDQYGDPMKEDRRRRVGHILEADVDEIRKYRSADYFLKSTFFGKYARTLSMQRSSGVLESECKIVGEEDPLTLEYVDQVRERIKANWVYPRPAGGREGELRIEFHIARDGRLEYIELRHSSGTQMLDDAALTAVKLAQPFPPVPEDIAESRIAINGQFRYQVVKGLVNQFLRLETVVSDGLDPRGPKRK